MGAEGLFLDSWDIANAAAMVAEPDGVNVREDPGSESPAVKTLSDETVVQLRVDEVDTVYTEGSRWWPVRIDGLIGWVSGKYLAPTESWTEPDVSTDASTVAEDISSKIADLFEAGSYVMANTDDGSGVNIRADGAPDAERIGMVPEGDVVQVMDGPSYDPIGNPWYLVTEGDVTGFVSGWYLLRRPTRGGPQPDRSSFEAGHSRRGHRLLRISAGVVHDDPGLRMQSLLLRTVEQLGRL